MKPFLLHQLIRAGAEARGDATAVVDGERAITYAELDGRSNRVANLLVEAGVRRGHRVGLYLDKSLESVVGIYGALKAGAAYVPLDPDAPAARLGFIAADCGLRVLLTGAEKSEAWPQIVQSGAVLDSLVVLNARGQAAGEPPAQARLFDAAAVDEQDDVPPPDRTAGSDLAYILYTSGSTGTPKGVMLSHRNALAFVDWAVDEFGVGPADRLSSHAPLHFDLSVFDLFAAAEGVAAVALVPPGASAFPVELRGFIERQRITVWYSVPSILSMLTLRGGLQAGALPSLRAILFAGEVFPTKYLRRLMQLLPDVRFANLYGPTETNVCTWYDVPPLREDRDDPIPIGGAIANTEVFAMAAEGRRAAPGEAGELHVRGPTVMQGYWNDPQRTAQSLVPNPLDPRAEGRVYRTGDLVQEQPDGAFRFLGRRDSQVKSRGYRIELGEIEAALYAHPAVTEAAVVAVPNELVTNRIRAFVVVRAPLSAAELLRHCATRLPRFMLPESIELREALPKTSTGKVDRQALSGAGWPEARRP